MEILTIVTFVRHLVDDSIEPFEFSDDRLSALTITAASFVNMDISASYTISMCSQSITPEPDSKFINLVSLKAACMLMRSVHTSWARNDFRVSDGPTTVDVKGMADKIKAAADDLCEQYEKSKLYYLFSNSGCIISTPNSDS